MIRHHSTIARSRQGGYTLFELMIALAMTLALMLGALFLFDSMNRVTKVQTNIADVQQTLRVSQAEMVRALRMAGRGGVATALTTNLAVPAGFGGVNLGSFEVRNNLGQSGNTDRRISVTTGAPSAVMGSDMLIVRGVFSTPLYQVRQSTGSFVVRDVADAFASPDNAARGVVIVCASSSDIEQSLQPLRDFITAGAKEPLVLVSRVNQAEIMVVEADFGISRAVLTDATECPGVGALAGDGVEIEFYVRKATNAGASDDLESYRLLSSNPTLAALPATMNAVSQVAVLEEYRFFVDQDSNDRSRLGRARMIPGTEKLWNNALSSVQVFAENVLDLQASLGFDSKEGNCAGGADCSFDADTDYLGEDDLIYESDDGDADDWLFNSAADDATGPPWTPALGDPFPDLQLVRVSVVAQTEGADPYFTAPRLENLEDTDYDVRGFNPTPVSTPVRYRRRVLQTTVELRNH